MVVALRSSRCALSQPLALQGDSNGTKPYWENPNGFYGFGFAHGFWGGGIKQSTQTHSSQKSLFLSTFFFTNIYIYNCLRLFFRISGGVFLRVWCGGVSLWAFWVEGFYPRLSSGPGLLCRPWLLHCSGVGSASAPLSLSSSLASAPLSLSSLLATANG